MQIHFIITVQNINHFQDCFLIVFHLTSRTNIKSSGYIVDTFEAAIWCLLKTNSYSTCVLQAVNLGGDTDTIAAIAGGLAEILYGFDAIHNKWISSLIKHKYIDSMCLAAAQNWYN